MHSAQTDEGDTEGRTSRLSEQTTSRSAIGPRRVGTEDSWIEIASQPSSSSLHSLGNNDIITTGLQVRRDDERRSRRLRQSAVARSASVAGSSQDEYEESESESDRVLGSSNEDMSRADNEDDALTALGVRTANRAMFTPQPNAFSHPPANTSHSTPAPDSYFPPLAIYSDRLPSNRMITQRTISQRQQNRNSESDHDAALRASLTTLLSCAAAVRPKERETGASIRRSNQPTTLRLVPESELNALPVRADKKKRSREASKDRQAKKMKAIRTATSQEELMSPTVMTWMISAGVVLVFSAISFSAGYAWGREIGRVEGGLSCNNCGREAIKAGSGGLRRLRWTTAAQSVRA